MRAICDVAGRAIAFGGSAATLIVLEARSFAVRKEVHSGPVNACTTIIEPGGRVLLGYGGPEQRVTFLDADPAPATGRARW